jgi:predicted metalloprotease with PDZ domain
VTVFSYFDEKIVKMKNRYITLFFVFLFYSGYGQEKQKIQPDRISYVVSPVSLSDRTNLEIDMTLPGETDGNTLIQLPIDNFGTSNMYQAIAGLSVKDATVITVAGKPAHRVINHKPGQTLQIHYTLSWDPLMSNASYRPDVSANHFHFFGNQWLVKPASRIKDTFQITMSFKDVPGGWKTYSNMQRENNGYSYTGSYWQLSGFIAGGDYLTKDFTVKDTKLSFIASRHYKNNFEKIAGDLNKIVASQRAFFNDYSQKDFLILLTHRSSQMAGVAITDAFVCLADSANKLLQLYKLLAHETFHAWLPGKAKVVKPEVTQSSFYLFEWFDEGFTEYCSKKMLFTSGIITEADFVDLVNQDLIDLARNPVNNSSFAQVSNSIEKNEFYSTYKLLSYQRGALMAFNWDHLIQKRSGGRLSVSDLVKKIVDTAIVLNKEHIPDSLFFNIVENKYHISAKKDWEEIIVNGSPLMPLKDALADKKYELVDSTVFRFSAGFAIDSSMTAKKIIGVKKDGNAEKNGLRDGLKVIDIKYSTWDKPVTVVYEEEGMQKSVAYLPRGARTDCRLFRRIY